MDSATPVNKNPGTATSGRTVGGRYTLGATVGSGGMGTVWRAHDELLRRDVAVKEVLLPPGLPARERDLLCERTLREARAAAALNHPAVVRVYDVVNDSDRPWIVMELLEARSISEVLRDDGPMPIRKVAEMGLAVLGALEAAHRVGVLHRDVKPGNVLLGADGRTTLTDFGVARSANESPLTSTGLLLGSPQYIAPERARGQQFGPSSDLWSLGATLYTAVEGRAPFDRGDPLPTMTAVVCEPPDPTSFAGALAPILDGLLAKNPDERWDAARTRSALKSVLAGGSSAPAPDAAPRQQQRHLPDGRGFANNRLGPAAGAARPAARALESTGAMESPLEDTGAMEATGAMSPPTPPRRPVSPAPPPPPPAAARTQVRPAGREYGRPLAAPDATSMMPGTAPPPPGQPAPTAVYRPVSGAPVSAQPVSGTPRRAAYLNSPEAMRASAAGETSPVPNPGRVVDPRQQRYVLFAVIAVLVVLVMGISAYAIAASFSDEDPKAPTNPSPKPAAAVQMVTHTDDRFTVEVPEGWTRKDGKLYVDYLGASGAAGPKIRILVEPGASNPETAIEAAEGFQREQETKGLIMNFQTIRKEPSALKLDGRDTWEWEWTYVTVKDNQQRRVLWRNTVVGERRYSVFVSAPDNDFDKHSTLLDAMTKSFRFTGS